MNDDRYNIYLKDKENENLIDRNKTYEDTKTLLCNYISKFLEHELPDQKRYNEQSVASFKDSISNLNTLNKFSQCLGDNRLIVKKCEVK